MTKSYDTNGDGKIDSKETYTYDANSNLTKYASDEDNDGKIDYAEIYTYDADSNILTKSYINNDKLSRKEIYTYDNHGNKLSMEIDEDGDGKIDYKETFSYS